MSSKMTYKIFRDLVVLSLCTLLSIVSFVGMFYAWQYIIFALPIGRLGLFFLTDDVKEYIKSKRH